MAPPFQGIISVPGYEIGEVIGRGGMGLVFRAREPKLGRDVAIKVLVAESGPQSSLTARFRLEARLMGQLEHPGVPAVHELGTLDDGRPFLAMKLVRGLTLQSLLAERTSAEEGRSRLVAVFEQVCRAVGYAHAHQIIHRDLKPANIMVGSHGEVQVMDWGLAKVLGQREPDPDTPSPHELTTAAPEEESGDTPQYFDSATRVGAILGTPAFMPPEQAGGEIRKLNAQSDVFGLGAILFQILTGKPPYSGKDLHEVRIKAVRGDLKEAFAALEDCKAEPELAALCRRCFSFEQAKRPTDGRAVAEEVERIRTQSETRARQAELERNAAMIREAEVRKRRSQFTFATVTICSILILGLLGTGMGLYLATRSATAERNAKQAALDAAEQERQAMRRAQEMTRLALQTNSKMVFGLQEVLRMRAGTQPLRRQLLESAREGLGKVLEEGRKIGRPDHTLLTSYLHMGDLELSLGNTTAAQKEYDTAHEMAAKLVAQSPADRHAQRDLSFSYEKLGDLQQQLGNPSSALAIYQKMREINERLAQEQPQDLGAQRDFVLSLERCADVTLLLGNAQAAAALFEQSLPIYETIAAQNKEDPQAQRDLCVIYNKLGDLFRQLSDKKKAATNYEKMLAISQTLAATDPENPQLQRDHFVSLSKMGDLLLEENRAAEARRYGEASLTLRKQLAEADRHSASAQRDLSVGFKGLGDIALRLGKTSEAIELYNSGLAIVARLSQADAKNSSVQRDLGVSYNSLGNAYLQEGRFAESLDFYLKGLEVRKQLAEANPSNVMFQHDLATSFLRKATVYEKTFEFALAAEAYDAAAKIAQNYQQTPFANELPIFQKKAASCRQYSLAIEDLESIFRSTSEPITTLLFVRLKTLLHRQQPDLAIATAERFAAWADQLSGDQKDQSYNAACAFALCAVGVDQQERMLELALARLTQLKTSGYFDAAKIAHLKQDPDFHRIRSSPKFSEFVTTLEAK